MCLEIMNDTFLNIGNIVVPLDRDVKDVEDFVNAIGNHIFKRSAVIAPQPASNPPAVDHITA